MPEVKLSAQDKRDILHWDAYGREPTAIARAFKITPQYVRKIIKAAKGDHFAYDPCWYCGKPPLEDDIFCGEACADLWRAAHKRAFESGDLKHSRETAACYSDLVDTEFSQEPKPRVIK